MKIGAIILAAGQASHFKSAKQLLEIDGQNLVLRACDLAVKAQCSPVIVVSGAYHEELQRCEFPEEVTLIENLNWKNGMGSSIAKGIEQVTHTGAEAVLILLTDQPAVTVETIERMREKLSEPHVSIVRCDNGESLGPPSLFKASHFSELLTLDDDFGGKEIIKSNASRAATIDAPEARWDIDNQECWDSFRKEYDKG